MKGFAQKNDFQKTIINVMMGLQADKLDLQDLAHTFKKMSNNGQIDKASIQKANKELQNQKLGFNEEALM